MYRNRRRKLSAVPYTATVEGIKKLEREPRVDLRSFDQNLDFQFHFQFFIYFLFAVCMQFFCTYFGTCFSNMWYLHGTWCRMFVHISQINVKRKKLRIRPAVGSIVINSLWHLAI